MKPAWDELMDDYEDSPSYLVGDVDCTSPEGKKLCSKHGVRGYPTILWGDPNDMVKYKGGRTADALKEHIETNMKPLCSPFNPDVCDADQKAVMEKFSAMDASALGELLSTTQQELKVAEAEHNKLIKEAEASFKAIKDEKTSDISMMKSVTAFAKKDVKDEL